jgi:copper/silver efflux system protein
MVKKVIEYCLENRALVLAIFVVLLILSLQYAFKVKLDALPDLSDPQVIIQAQWEGRTPQTIQDQIIYPLTRYLVSLPKIKVIRSLSFYDFGLIFIIFQDGVDLDWARKRVDLEIRAGRFNKPQDAALTIAPDATSVGWVFQYYLEDKNNKYDLGELHSLNEFIVKQHLLSIEGVAEVAIIGGFRRAFQIILDPLKLFQYQISPQEIKEIIQKNNKDEGMGIVEFNEKEFMVAGKGYIKSFEDIENLVIKTTQDGIPVRILDVALTINLAPLPRRGALEIDGKGEATGGIVIARYHENAYKICKKVNEKISQINKLLPEGVTIKTAYDRSQLIKRAIDILIEQLLEITATLFFVIIVFILHLPSTLVCWIILPIVILMTFALLSYFDITSNIMSVGGIAIALGDIADGVISLIENVHKKKEREGHLKSYSQIVKEATTDIGPGIFASILVLSVSFLPVLALKGQAGRLFYPLAFTKITSLFIAAILTITVIPVFIQVFAKGKTIPEHKNPLNKLMINTYMLIIKLCFKYKALSLIFALIILASIIYPFSKLSTEFLPALEEGDILYMPTSIPSPAISTTLKTIAIQNKILKTFPEVEVVWGKIGRADTATDPAPLEMFETTIKLKPYNQWQKRIVEKKVIEKFLLSIFQKYKQLNEEQKNTLASLAEYIKHSFEKNFRLLLLNKSYNEALTLANENLKQLIKEILITNNINPNNEISTLNNFVKTLQLREVKSIFELMFNEMDKELTIPGFPNIWSMPIRVRLDMLSTGIRSPVGIKIFGQDYKQLEKLGIAIEQLLKNDSQTLSVIAQRLGSGYYLLIEPDRKKCARLGVNISDVFETIRLAIAGEPISEIVDGLYRYFIVLRYPPNYKDNIENLHKLLIKSAWGTTSIAEVAKITKIKDISSIPAENSIPTMYVYITPKENISLSKYIKHLHRLITQNISFPTGYSFSISGQYEYVLQMYNDLKIILPLTIVIVFIILYLVIKDFCMTIILLITLGFSIVGAYWFLYFKGYNLNIAIYAGTIVLLGFASQTAIMMHVFLEEAIRRHLNGRNKMSNEEFINAILDGAVLRVRPKIMSVATSFFGLLPIIFSSAKEASLMTQLAAPMVGGDIEITFRKCIIKCKYFLII